MYGWGCGGGGRRERERDVDNKLCNLLTYSKQLNPVSGCWPTGTLAVDNAGLKCIMPGFKILCSNIHTVFYLIREFTRFHFSHANYIINILTIKLVVT